MSLSTSNFKEMTENTMPEPTLVNQATDKRIFVNMKDGDLLDFPMASDNLNISALSDPVEKSFICYPKSCRID